MEAGNLERKEERTDTKDTMCRERMSEWEEEIKRGRKREGSKDRKGKDGGRKTEIYFQMRTKLELEIRKKLNKSI